MKLTMNQLYKTILILYCLIILSACETVKKTYKVLSNPDIQVGDRLDQPSLYSLSIYATNRINTNPYSDNLSEKETENVDLELSDESELSNEELFEHVEYQNDLSVEEQDSSDKVDEVDFVEDETSKGENIDKKIKKIEGKQQSSEEDEHIIVEETQGEALEATPVSLIIVQLAEKSLFLSATYDELNVKKLKKTLGKTYLDHEELMIDPNQFRFFENKAVEKRTRYIGVIAYFNDEVSSQWRDVIKIRSNGETYPLLIRVSENDISLYKDN